MQRNIILIFISLIIVLIFINAKPLPNIKPSPEKNDETKKKLLFKPRSKEYYDNLFKKGLKLDDIIPEKERRKEKINYKEDKKRRRVLVFTMFVCIFSIQSYYLLYNKVFTWSCFINYRHSIFH